MSQPVFENSLELMINCLKVKPSTGLNLEFGVFSGKTINECAKFLPNEKFIGFDSFFGLPEHWRGNMTTGWFNRDGVPPQVEKNVELQIGWFKDTIPPFVMNNKESKISFLHVDCDIYSSTKLVLESLKHMFQKGTIILFDEFYNYLDYEQHEYKAWNEFLQDNPNIKIEGAGVCKWIHGGEGSMPGEQTAFKILEV